MNKMMNESYAIIANYFYFDHANEKIKGSELNFRKSGIPTTPQYEALMAAKALQPTYTYGPIAPKVKKQSYAGLNFDLIMDYVDWMGTEAQKAELEEIVNNNANFATIKSWFLDYFKAGFTVEKAMREIEIAKRNAKKKLAEETLKNTKATIRKTVKARIAKATPAVVEMPVASNF